MTTLSNSFLKFKYNYEFKSFNNYLSNSELLPNSMTNTLKLEGHKGCINTCNFNPIGDNLITGCDDGSTWVWDITNRLKEPIIYLKPHKTNVFTTNFLSSNVFISGGNDSTVQVIYLTESEVKSRIFHEHHIKKVLCSFVIDSNTFVTCAADQTIRLFDIRCSYNNTNFINLPFLIKNDFNYNGHEQLTNDLIKYNLKFQGEGGGSNLPLENSICNESLLINYEKNKILYYMDVDPLNKKRFLTSSNDGTIRIFDLRNISNSLLSKCPHVGFSLRERYQNEVEITGASFNEDGSKIAASVLGGSIHVFDTSNAKILNNFKNKKNKEITFDLNNFNNDEDLYLRISELLRNEIDSEIIENDIEEEEEIQENFQDNIIELTGHQSNQTIKAVNWFGKFVVTGSDDYNIYFYDIEKSKIIKILKGHTGNVNVVSVHKEKRLLATTGIDDYVNLWEPLNLTNYNSILNEKEINEILNSPNNNENILDCLVM